ncbi:hypothetical protein [Sorangium sp. So ce854]|uniref:Phosphate ABC transporter substrate-binding protein n=1 Tax=Sorangium cellulosum TaxID=56 RepID=A0A150P875_SORCE|nr:hypothetical protein BE08_43765 [Sorangium cellulosum]
MKRLSLLLLLALLGMTPSASSFAVEEEIVVVVNQANPVRAAGRDTLRPIFQTTRTEWYGRSAVPLNLPEDSPLRQRFDMAVLGLDPEGVARYWIDRKIRGGERPPRKVASTSAVVRVVGEEAGGIGYVAAGDVNPSVKVIARIRDGQVVPP